MLQLVAFSRGSREYSGFGKARVLAGWLILTPWEAKLQALESNGNTASARSEHLTELKFSEFSLAPELSRGIADAGFTYCTPIQSKTLPIARAGRDVAGQAQTGTGKTAAYLIALFQYLLTQDRKSVA